MLGDKYTEKNGRGAFYQSFIALQQALTSSDVTLLFRLLGRRRSTIIPRVFLEEEPVARLRAALALG